MQRTHGLGGFTLVRKETIIKVAVIDADLIGRAKHLFPNLACMKLSAYYKSIGAEVELKLDYNNLDKYDKVTISKVFMDTEIPEEPQDKSLKDETHIAAFYKDNPILNLPNVEYGGTGFFYDKAPPLPDYVEHIKPDYHLYDEWVKSKIESGSNPKNFQYYTDYSIGFTSRGCIRRCSFCVNKNYRKCSLHSPVSEFVDESRPYIVLLDDNIFACSQWRQAFDTLIDSGKKFVYKQGLDERLLDEEKCEVLFRKANWINDRTFSFDNIRDWAVIEDKLKLIRSYPFRNVKFYLLCAYNHDNPGHYDQEFWKKDIVDLFERIKLLMTYGCLSYVMKYKDFELSPYRGFYMVVAWWCNRPSMYKTKTIVEYAQLDQARTSIECASVRYLRKVAEDFPDIAEKYYNMRYSNLYKK